MEFLVFGTLILLTVVLALFAVAYKPGSPTESLIDDDTIVDEDGWEYKKFPGQPIARYVNGPNKGKTLDAVKRTQEALRLSA